jgi:hypothetical protein
VRRRARHLAVVGCSTYCSAMGVSNSRVDVFPHHVEKYAPAPESTARKYAAVHEIAAAHGFIAPRVLKTRSDHVLLERIDDIVSLRELYLSENEQALNTAVSRAGEVLARLHAHLPRTDAAEWSAPPGFSEALRRYVGRDIDIEALPRAVLHGDYSFANVLISHRSPDSIAVIDPCANFGSTFDDWSLAPVYVDVGKMLACLEGQIPFRRQHQRPGSARIGDLQHLFMSGYERIGPSLDREIAHGFAYAVASAQFRRRFGRLSALHRVGLYNRFRGNFPCARKLHGAARGAA